MNSANHTEFFSPRQKAYAQGGPRKTEKSLIGMFLALGAFFFWAYFFELQEITKASGKIISSSRIQTLNNSEGGIIKDILVQDDQVVSKGQVLIRLDTTITQARYSEEQESFYRLLARQERLLAQVDHKDKYIPSQLLMMNASAIALSETSLFEAYQGKRTNELKISKQEYLKKKQELSTMEEKLENAQDQLKLVTENDKILKPMAKKGIYSRVDYIRAKRDKKEQIAQLGILQKEIKEKKTEIKLAQHQIDKVVLQHKVDVEQELHDVKGKLAEINSARIADQSRVMRAEIRAPMAGTIREIKTRTVGAFVQPGEAILDIVPLNDNLIVEAQVSPADIGFLHPGMAATIKVTAYDYSSYGGLEATVEEISPDTISDKHEQSYYRVLLRTNSNVLIKNGISHQILPGMQVEADILAGKRSVLSYLWKPFTRALENSLTER